MLSKEDAFLITAFTGKMCMDFYSFHELVEKEFGRPVWTHEMASESFWEELRKLVKDRFIAICYERGRND